MLSNKINLSWNSLLKEHKKELCDVILTKIQEPSASHALKNGLCLSITNIILQSTPHDWPDPITDISFLSVSPSIDNNQQLNSTNFSSSPDTRLAWIGIMRTLAEEIDKSPKFISSSHYEQLKLYCRESSSEKVILRLLELIQENCENDQSNIASDAMETLEKWILLAPPITEAITQTVFTVATSILINPSILASCGAEVINEVLTLSNLPKYPNMVLYCLHQVLRLESVLEDALQDEDLDTIEALLTIFTSFGINHPTILLQNPEVGVKLTQLVCRCSSIKVGSECFEFWKELQDALSKESDDDNLQEVFKSCFEDVVHLLLQQSKYPANHEEDEELQEAVSEIDKFRNDSGDCLLQLYTTIPDEELKILYELIENSLVSFRQTGSAEDETWIEVGLWGWKALSEDLTDEEEWPFKLMKLFYELPQDSLKIQTTAIKLMGSMTHWLQLHPQAIPTALDYITSTLSVTELTSYATSALRGITDDCGELLLPYLPALLEKLEEIVGYLKPQDQCIVVSCLANQVTFLESEQAFDLLVKLAGGLPQQLIQITQETDNFNHLQRQKLIDGLNFISILFVSPGDPLDREDGLVGRKVMVVHPTKHSPNEKYINQVEWAQRSLVPLADLTWPIAEAVVNNLNLDEEFCAPVLKYITSAVGAMKRLAFAPLLPKALSLLVTMFQRTLSTSILKTYGTLAGIYRSYYSHQDLERLVTSEREHLVQLGLIHPAPAADIRNPPCEVLVALSNCFISLSGISLQGLHSSDGQPNIADIELLAGYYHYCAGPTLSYLPRVFFNIPDTMQSVCQFVADILTSVHQPKSLRVLTRFIETYYAVNHETVMLPEDIPALLQFKFSLFGALMANSMKAVGGAAPRSELPVYSQLIYWFLVHFPQQTSSILSELLSQEGFPSPSITMEQKKMFLSKILQSQQSSGTLGLVLHDMAVICRSLDSTILGSVRPF